MKRQNIIISLAAALLLAPGASASNIFVASGGETYGEPTTAMIGPYGSPTTGSNSSGAVLPHDVAYSNSYAQAIYTPTEIGVLSGADGTDLADITSLSFKMLCDYMMPEGMLRFDVYIQNYDGTAFPLSANKTEQWVARESAVHGVYESPEYYYDELVGEQEFEVSFDSPLRYLGKSLLVTWVSSGTFADLYQNRFESQVFRAGERQSAVTSEDREIDNLTGNAKNLSSDLPVLKVGYTPVFVASLTPKLGIENLTVSVREVSVDRALGALGSISKANAISLSFDISDETDGNQYQITLDNKLLGTVTGRHAVVSNLGIPNAAMRLSVAPVAEGVNGCAAMVHPEDFENLFAVPDVSPGNYSLQASYTVHEDRSATVAGVATFGFEAATELYAKMACTCEGQVRIVTGSEDMPDAFASFIPLGEYFDYQRNKALSLYNPVLASTPVAHGRLTDASGSISATIRGKFSLEYPIVVQELPDLGTAFASDGDFDIASATGRTIGKVTREYDNGATSTYQRGMAIASLCVNEDNPLIVATEHPLKFVYVHDEANGFMDFFVQRENSIHYCFEPEQTPLYAVTMEIGAGVDYNSQWVDTSDCIFSFQKQSGNLHVRNVTASGVVKDEHSYYISDQGLVTDVQLPATEIMSGHVEWFNLQGQRVQNPGSGIFLKRCGAQVYKVKL